MDGSWIDKARYVLTLAMWIMLPAAFVYWFLIHPLAAFWRRLGKVVTFTTMFFIMAGTGYVFWLWREPVMAKAYPFRPWMALIGLALYALAIVIERKCRKHLKLRILVGMPELSADDPGQLLTDGIYAHTRNPRYLDIIIGMFGWSLILNYPVMYWLAVVCVPGFYAITLLEERELRQRFGEPYEEYLRSVPRFMPRSWAFLRS